MKHLGQVTIDASESEAMRAFNMLVQHQLPRMLGRSVGRGGLPYRRMVAMTAGYTLVSLDYMCGAFCDGLPTRWFASFAILNATVHFAAIPLILAFISWMTK